ncbi:MAG: hypothetical protein DHS20C17_16650 [Cyclobacteriaceae bacterium]|nr:MAG: hypothetical protein DHS20C17_16650 [Cyclobacteriaceae bacterium]
MNEDMDLTRRDFIYKTTASALGISMVPVSILRGAITEEPSQISIFSKYLGFLDYHQLGEAAATLGFDGIDLAVRPGGHVLPEDVKTNLAPAISSLKSSGIAMPMMVTNIVDADHEHTESMLCTASDLGINHYRMGYYQYDNSQTIIQNLDACRRKLEKLEKLNRRCGIQGCYQNHSGPQGFVGGPVWDLYHLMKDFSPDYLGVQFDIMHATVEAGYSWPAGLKLLAPWVNSVALMDFSWIDEPNRQNSQGVPLGQGNVDFEKLAMEMKQIEFSGPITIKCEHLTQEVMAQPLSKTDKQSILAKLKNDLNYYRNTIQKYG